MGERHLTIRAQTCMINDMNMEAVKRDPPAHRRSVPGNRVQRHETPGTRHDRNNVKKRMHLYRQPPSCSHVAPLFSILACPRGVKRRRRSPRPAHGCLSCCSCGEPVGAPPTFVAAAAVLPCLHCQLLGHRCSSSQDVYARCVTPALSPLPRAQHQAHCTACLACVDTS